MKPLAILSKALILSENFTRSFSETELGNSSSVSSSDLMAFFESNQTLFRKTSIKKFPCNSCRSDIDVSTRNDNYFCKNCGNELRKDQVPLFQLTLNYFEVKNFIQSSVLNIFEKNAWNILFFDDSFAILKKNEIKIALSISIKQAYLQDYFLLRGWSQEYHPETFIIAGINFDFLIQSLSGKDFKCNLLSLTELLETEDIGNLEARIKSKINEINAYKEIEQTASLTFSRYGDLSEIFNNLRDILANLEKYALQIGSENAKVKGERFQKYVISLLNLTLFKAKLAGGPNQPDGMIFFFDDKKPRWYLIEVKSFKDKIGNGFYPLKESTSQIKKYSSAFKKQEIAQRIQTPAYIIIASDFDIKDEEQKKIMLELRKDAGMEIVLFPLKSIILMVNLFLKNNIAHIPNDISENIFSVTGYISETQINELFKKLIKHNEEADSFIHNKARQYVKVQGK